MYHGNTVTRDGIKDMVCQDAQGKWIFEKRRSTLLLVFFVISLVNNEESGKWIVTFCQQSLH